MPTLVIRGRSDDIVEVDGDFHDEFYPSDIDDFYIAVSDGTILRGEYDRDGIWRFKTLVTGSGDFTKTEGNEDSYSDEVTISGKDVRWVVVADPHYAKA